ncbi:Thiol:disulfide interchange protein DsbD [Koleobacter methoxysyntrophicus]|uniref:Thiol:disulfide interchange protein DsbD n=1 Tax=Koleobacter methoxysyntrophicus TaxID=2751313 RepID=A0A8A0RMH9_9FIRM|nr:cytochrome c biogenesis protein CcdA [Koleobacter methoxysyntrophicus]QSQ09453.1 Thiol:disulfide interchange protein DsbD [Koleobacter methoxysyntrophicus]
MIEISGQEVGFFVAFGAGMLSFFSPCVLPLVPAYITFLAGTALEGDSAKNRRFLFLKAIGFIVGFSLIFTAMGASASLIGKFLLKNRLLYRKISGIVIVLFGVHMTGIFNIKPLYREKRFIRLSSMDKSWFSPFVIGCAFAAGWTPCVGPILASILLYAGTGETVSFGVFLLTAYSMGLAVPFIITSMALNWFMKIFKKSSRLLPHISALSGVILIIFGIMIYFNKIALLSRYLDWFNVF